MHGMRRVGKYAKVARRFCTAAPEPEKKSLREAIMNTASRGPITFASLAIAAVAGAGVLTYYELEKEKKVLQVASEIVTTGKPALGGPWVLIDQDGIPRTDASYKGEFALLYFGFTYCPDICPSELVKVGKIIDGLGKLAVSSKIEISCIHVLHSFQLSHLCNSSAISGFEKCSDCEAYFYFCGSCKRHCRSN